MTGKAPSADTREFFLQLAVRLRTENPLSDLTYAALQSLPGFRSDFVSFLYPTLSTHSHIEVSREETLKANGGRPDFVLRSKGWTLIIENKLWDRNYHFSEYEKHGLGAPTHLAIIANHQVPPRAGWSCKRWEEFIQYFERKSYGDASAVFSHYLAFVKKVCAMSSYDRFTLSSEALISLRHFNHMIEAAIRNVNSPEYTLSFEDRKSDNFGESWSGRFFSLKARDRTLKLFFGVDYSWASPHVTVDVHRGDNRDCWEAIRESRALYNSKAFVRVQPERETMLQLRLPEADFVALNACQSKDQQLDTLISFLVSCCRALLAAVGNSR